MTDRAESNSNHNENETIQIKFGANEESDEERNDSGETEGQKDLSTYTMIDADHLTEDRPIPGQEYCLLSFLSPEGVMNCNIRAIKFRGAFPTLERAIEYSKKLEGGDGYFKIFCGESGKWVEFDPPVERVERELTSNPKHQKILDAQREQRSKKLNELAGRFKETIDRKDAGKDLRIRENKKVSAADELIRKNNIKADIKQEHDNTAIAPKGRNKLDTIREGMRKKLADKKMQQKSTTLSENNRMTVDTNEKDETTTVQKNIDHIRNLMGNSRLNKD